ncbi:interferon-inducible GTPase 1-like [Mercenaria mercenaria]|uniref:interferon-inducible GTPase 1-like n=1 Tax=Mercenaria mercenaria TaxID=6596 RepID=UPI00234EF60A|nr:interferon-inducible GTPase 1-like [Mercenaria mercenaria]
MAAEVGENETTLVCRHYPHPENENIVYWDVPGCGTKHFPSESYLEKIQIYRYDVFLLVSSGRFHELDIWLAGELKKRKKRHYFKIKSRILTSLGTTDDINVFLVSNHHPQQYEFPNLLLNLADEANIHKRISLTFGVAGLSTAILNEKVNALRQRTGKIAILAALGYMYEPAMDLHIPLLNSLLQNELVFYRRQLSLDVNSLEKLANIALMNLESLKNLVQLKSIQSISEKDIGLLIDEAQKQTVLQKPDMTALTFPLSILLLPYKIWTYKIIKNVLSSQLTLMVKDAKKVLETVVSKKAFTV